MATLRNTRNSEKYCEVCKGKLTNKEGIYNCRFCDDLVLIVQEIAEVEIMKNINVFDTGRTDSTRNNESFMPISTAQIDILGTKEKDSRESLAISVEQTEPEEMQSVNVFDKSRIVNEEYCSNKHTEKLTSFDNDQVEMEEIKSVNVFDRSRMANQNK